jgi:tRNA A37 methylthiotransferase MiaB
MTKKVFIRTFGCEIHKYDSNKMLDLLAGTEGVVRING